MNSNQEATINQAIKLLQSVLSATSKDDIVSVDISIPDYDSQIKTFYDKAHSLEPEIQKLTEIFKTASSTMKKILQLSYVCKKYSAGQQEKLKNIFMSLSNEVDTVMKNPNFIDQCRAIKELLSATFWIFVATPQFIIKGAVEAADYNALKFQKKKVKEHNDWWTSVSGACKTLQKYVTKNHPMGLMFNPKGEDKWDLVLLSGWEHKFQSKSEQKPLTIEQKPKQVEVQKVKQPKKLLVGQTWQIRNYQKEEMNLSKQIQMKHNIFIENCKDMKIKVSQKCKSVQMNKSENMTLEVKSCVSGVELMNCKNITVIIKQRTPSISIDKSDKVMLHLNENNNQIDIVSCKASELNVVLDKSNGEQSKQYLISDQLITKWNSKSNKFQTKIYDKFL